MHGCMALPVTDSSVSKLDVRPMLFQKKVGFGQCCGLTMAAACLKGGSGNVQLG